VRLADLLGPAAKTADAISLDQKRQADRLPRGGRQAAPLPEMAAQPLSDALGDRAAAIGLFVGLPVACPALGKVGQGGRLRGDSGKRHFRAARQGNPQPHFARPLKPAKLFEEFPPPLDEQRPNFAFVP
jgi:hypothetical protein